MKLINLKKINKILKYAAYFIVFCILAARIFYIKNTFFVKMDNPDYIGRGFCHESEPYILPKVYKDFITEEEKQYIINKATPFFKKSGLVSETGYDESVRKSETAWLSREDSVVKSIIKRVCTLTGVPFENAESLQVVKYGPNGFYKEHHDSFCRNTKEDYEAQLDGGQRLVTMLLYLTDGFEGGATRFPNLNLDVKPDANSGILFYPLQKNGNKCHPHALHGGLPVISGQKYIANVWLREGQFNE